MLKLKPELISVLQALKKQGYAKEANLLFDVFSKRLYGRYQVLFLDGKLDRTEKIMIMDKHVTSGLDLEEDEFI